MNPVLKNTIAVVAGIFFGSAVNMGIIMISGHIIPPPEGVDVADMESLKASIHLFQPKHFIMPFLAHAIGTLIGAVISAKIAVNHKIKFGLGIGAFFLIGGVANVFMIPSPIGFVLLDLSLAYIPMGFLGSRLAR